MLHETLNDATHRFMIAEVQSKGLAKGGNPAKWLKKNFNAVKNLTEYWAKTQRLLNANLFIYSVGGRYLAGGPQRAGGFRFAHE